MEELKWLDTHDWHPVDERELKKSLAVELEKIRKGRLKKNLLFSLRVFAHEFFDCVEGFFKNAFFWQENDSEVF